MAEKRLAELGIAASVDYCDDNDDERSSTMLLNSDNDDDNDSSAPILPIGLTPTSSPEQLPDLLPHNNNHSKQFTQSQQKSSDVAAKLQEDLSKIGNLEVFALK